MPLGNEAAAHHSHRNIPGKVSGVVGACREDGESVKLPENEFPWKCSMEAASETEHPQCQSCRESSACPGAETATGRKGHLRNALLPPGRSLREKRG